MVSVNFRLPVMHILLPLFTALLWTNLAMAQSAYISPSPLGTWLTIDDKTGEVKSHIRIYEKEGKQYGQIIKVTREDLNHLCDQCEGERKNKPMVGMVIIEDMVYGDGFWRGGRVLFPKQGKWFNLKYWLQPGDPNMLVLMGYYGPFYRTQRWKRAG